MEARSLMYGMNHFIVLPSASNAYVGHSNLCGSRAGMLGMGPEGERGGSSPITQAFFTTATALLRRLRRGFASDSGPGSLRFFPFVLGAGGSSSSLSRLSTATASSSNAVYSASSPAKGLTARAGAAVRSRRGRDWRSTPAVDRFRSCMNVRMAPFLRAVRRDAAGAGGRRTGYELQMLGSRARSSHPASRGRNPSRWTS